MVFQGVLKQTKLGTVKHTGITGRLAGFLAAAVMLASASSEALSAQLDCIFEHYSTEDGLPHNSIADIHQDRDGYIWLCTWYGLSRFDGNTFVNYTTLPGDYANISHNRILSIKEDACGYLWLTTYDYRLYRFDKTAEKFVAIPDDLQDSTLKGHKVDEFYCDSDGCTWIALQDHGLCKVTPDLKTVSYAGRAGIGKSISSIYESSDGTVYVVSESGISSVRGTEVSLISRVHEVVGFEELGSRLYFASGDQLLIVDKATGIQSRTDLDGYGLGDATVMEVTGSAQKDLYLGFSGSAVARVDTLSGALDVMKSGMGRVRYLYPDSCGMLWIATDRTGIWSYSPGRQKFRHYEHPRNVMSYYTDTLARVVEKGGMTWVKMNGYGFGWYDRENDSIVPLHNVKEHPDCRFMNGVACFEVDSSGVLWFSTVLRGLERVTTINPRVDIITPPTVSGDRMSSSEVRAMLRDSKDNVWVATKSRELYVYTPDMSSCRRISEAGSIGIVYSIFEDSSGNIWLGTKGDGLTRMSLTPEGKISLRQFRHSPYDRNSISSDNVYSVSQDLSGRIWVGTFGGGLSMLQDPDATEFRTVYNDFPGYPLENGDRVRHLYCMKDGRMLVATVGGLIWFYPQDNTELVEFHSVRKIPGDMHSLGNNDIIYIFADSRDSTWLCTFGGGIDRLHFEGEEARFDVVSMADGLSSNIVLSAVCDDSGDIWLATEAGISRIGGDDWSVTNYTKYDGMLSTTFSEATCVRTADGRIAFGSLDDIYVISPEDFDYISEPKRLVLSSLQVDGKRVPVAGKSKVVIPHGYSFFRIDFASLNFKIQGNVRFSYKLSGYDKDWISSGSATSVTYSRIPHGNYEFMVRASSSGADVGDDETVSLKIRVRPSLWESAPAQAVYVLLVFCVAGVLIRMFMTSVKLRNDVKVEQQMNDLKVRFFTNISHELRTPLTLILGGIEELRKDIGPEGRKGYSANIVYKNARRMMTLVDQLLDIRRIVSGKMRLNVRQFDAVQMIREVYDDFKDMAAERSMELSLAHSVDSLKIWGDEGRLEALVYNLLSNAFKYTSDGGHIEVGIYYRQGAQDFTLSVKDDGVGVPKDKQEAIFEPFVQASDASYKGMSSSGIGLSFCKEIVDIHGGRIWVESQPGSGSCFYVTLPIDRDHFSDETAEFIEEDAESMQKDAEEMAGLSKYKVKPTFPQGALKVLVVEDNAELKIYIYNSLADRYDVRDASNGKEALDVIASGWMPDVIITDLMMPQMDGIQLINKIRSDFSTSHILIIMITAKHESDSHLQAMKYGADGYIVKPFTMELLTARMENLLERRRALLSAFSRASEAGTTQAQESSPGSGKVTISPSEVVITDRDKALIDKVMQWLEENVSNSDVTVDNLAVYVGMGRTSMYNKLKGLTGKSPVELIQDYRLEKATYYLKSGQMSVSETSYKVGFSDPGYFSRSFKKHFGLSPADYIKANKGKDDKAQDEASGNGQPRETE